MARPTVRTTDATTHHGSDSGGEVGTKFGRGLPGRLSIDNVSPVIAHGDTPAKATVGSIVPISASVWREGHDSISATLVVARPTSEDSNDAASPVFGFSDEGLRSMAEQKPGKGIEVTMTAETGPRANPDVRHGVIIPDVPGLWTFRIDAWSDPVATWRNSLTKKIDAGQNAEQLANDLEIGARLLNRAAAKADSRHADLLEQASLKLRDDSLVLPDRVALALSGDVAAVLAQHPVRDLVTQGREYQILVEPACVGVGSWYEFFPRSTGGWDADGNPVHGTFATAAEALPRIAGMGFDTVYLPPIHPIGTINRKGRNNTLTPSATDVGSPWAIGSADGGHDAIHPDLGTVEDFERFVAEADKLGLKVALDLALQCAPDHPWAAKHPDWFTVLPDGSIAYAENPPKKYQDIYPLNFDIDPQGLYAEVLRVVRLWIERGVRVFRVDNPHTKPTNFWAWLIGEIHTTDPDIVFLAEAFTRPPRLYGLAKAGFNQSYSYFTWKTDKKDLTEFARSVADGSDVFRPNLFVNTPDILHESLQTGGRPAFAIRSALAATMSPLWGVYSGFELFESVPVRAGSEEYLDSEKYELRPRDFAGALARGESLEPWLQRLNASRKDNPALLQQRNLHIHSTTNEHLLAYSRVDSLSGNAVLIVVNLDPHNPQEGEVIVDLEAVGLAARAGFDDDLGTADSYEVHDLVTGNTWLWGGTNYVRLDPTQDPTAVAHILQLPVVPESRREPLAYRNGDEEFSPRG